MDTDLRWQLCVVLINKSWRLTGLIVTQQSDKTEVNYRLFWRIWMQRGDGQKKKKDIIFGGVGMFIFL